MAKRLWLMKSEPSTFSIDDLARVGTTSWEGVRNYVARNHLREAQVGDEVLFYHSSADPTGVAGVAKVVKTAYPDPTQFDPKSDFFDEAGKREDPRWSAVDVAFVAKLPRVVTLDEIKAAPALKRMVLVQKGSRHSVQPVTAAEWKAVLAMAKREFGRPSGGA